MAQDATVSQPGVRLRDGGASAHTLEKWGRRICWLNVAVWLVALPIGFRFGLQIIVPAALLLTIGGLRRPSIALIGAAMLCALDPPARHFMFASTPLPFNTINYVFLLAIFFSISFQLQVKDISSRILVMLLGLLTLFLVVSPDKVGGAMHVLNAASFFGMLYFLTFAPSRSWYWSGVNAGIAAALGCFTYYIHLDLVSAYFFTINPNAWMFFPLTAIFVIFLAYSHAQTKKEEYLLLFLAVVNMVWTFLSTSRSGMVLSAIAVLFLYLRMRGPFRKTVLALAGAAIFTFAIIQFENYRDVMLERIITTLDSSYTLAERSNDRTVMMESAWEVFKDHPFGVGTGAFFHTMEAESQWYGAPRALQAHAGWMKVLAENGIVGFLLLVLFAISYLVIAMVRLDGKSPLMGIFAAAAISAAFFVTEFQPKGLWLLAAGVSVTYHRELFEKWADGARRVDRFLPYA